MALNGDFAKLGIRVGLTGIASTAQAATLLILARESGPSIYGGFGLLLSIGYMAGALTSFGLSLQALRVGTGQSVASRLFTMFVIRVVTASVVALSLVIVGISSGVVGQDVYLAATAMIFGELITELVQASLSGQGRQNRASVLIVLQRAVTLSAVVLPVWVGDSVWVQFSSAVLVSTAMSVCVVFPMLTPRLSSVAAALRKSRGYWAASLAASAGQLDVVVARTSVSEAASGLVAAGSRIATPLNLVTNAMLSVFVPSLTASIGRRQRRLFLRLRRLALLYAAFLTLSSPGIASVLVWILGEDFRPGWMLYMAIVLGAAMSGVSQTYQALLYSRGRPSTAALIVGGGTVVGLVALAVAGTVGGATWLFVGPLLGQAAILALFHFQWVISRNSQTLAD